MITIMFWHYSSLPQQASRKEFPTLFSIAMDYLPIQATSVPCERVFSSAKDTDTVKRNQISPVLMEALQMLKYSLKKERLNFMEGWQTSEAVMSGVPVSTGDLSSLFVDDPDAALDILLNSFGPLDEYDDRES
jgi:hAT family C-terminal dimerisation region